MHFATEDVRFVRRADGATLTFRRTWRRFWIAAIALWIVTCSVAIYQAYREPYDLWLILDAADVKYSECWAKASRTDPTFQQPTRRNIGLFPDQPWFETRRQEADRLRQVAACYREFNRVHQLTTPHDALKQGVLTMVAVPLLVFFIGWILLSFTSYPRSSEER